MNVITIQLNQVEWETNKAYLIKVPGTKYKFWISKKFTQFANSRCTKIRLIIVDDFKYTIFKNGNGQYNKHEKIDEKTISNNALLELFGYDLDDNNDIIDDLLDGGDGEC